MQRLCRQRILDVLGRSGRASSPTVIASPGQPQTGHRRRPIWVNSRESCLKGGAAPRRDSSWLDQTDRVAYGPRPGPVASPVVQRTLEREHHAIGIIPADGLRSFQGSQRKYCSPTALSLPPGQQEDLPMTLVSRPCRVFRKNLPITEFLLKRVLLF